jgi:MFS superfamily sulfate permease-like transporter
MKHVRSAMGTSFVIALLGFFESSVAAKGLGDGARDGIKGAPVSANREMVALGVANVAGSCFMALPAFGGYARSKVNASTGGRTQMSGIFLAIITVIVIIFLLPYLYYLPVSSSLRLPVEVLSNSHFYVESSSVCDDICSRLFFARRVST